MARIIILALHTKLKHYLGIFLILIAAGALMCACSSTKHVPEGQLLLDKVRIHVDNDTVKVNELVNFLRQTPNHKVLGFAKLQLATYSLSGKDSAKWYNRWLQRIGQAPVIYDSALTETSRRQLQQALINRGYMDAQVEVDTILRGDNRKIEVDYSITTGTPRRITNFNINVPDSAINAILRADEDLFKIESGVLFDRNSLDDLRGKVTNTLREHGYYAFSKENISFTADTVAGSKNLSLTMNVRPSARNANAVGKALDQVPFRINRVVFLTDANAIAAGTPQDTVMFRNLMFVYGPDRYIDPRALEEKCFIRPGQLYTTRAVERTYEGMSQLGILKFINIEMRPDMQADSVAGLVALISMSRNKKQGVTLELDGTNSEGDLGFGIGATYKHRNLAKRSNLLTVKFRAAYESLSGNAEGFINNRYSEYAGEVGITFPKFMVPFVNSGYKRRRNANTEFAISGNYQERPEYTRIIAGAAWRYKWSHRRGFRNTRHQFDLIDINYVRLPQSTLNFLDSIAPSNPLLRYSYEDHFIMRIGYTFYTSNKRVPTANVNAFSIQPSVTTVRGTFEAAGNLLYAISSISGQKKENGAYKVLNIPYSQYIKGEAHYTHTINFNSRSALSMHVGGGIAVPYLNSTMVPFEKRFYSGGANSVRGWGVRTLGPGSYDSRNSVTDFINQCGDIMLNFNLEYRAKLFWVLESAIFIDAGNIWTIRNYENQPGGVFRWNKFYRQLAAAYGVGLRMDFTYFLLRFDLGVKAHNPAMNQEEWPLIHPRWKRDTNFHFSVGYPF